jgi:hypothetical protein
MGRRWEEECKREADGKRTISGGDETRSGSEEDGKTIKVETERKRTRRGWETGQKRTGRGMERE